jgi:hypothetical protein
MQGQIQAAKQSQSGKTVSVQINGKWYSCKDFSVLKHIGEIVTFEESSSEWQGKTMLWMNEPTFGAAPEKSNGKHTSVSKGDTGYSQYQPLVSNLAAHLIAAGGAPSDLGPWFGACRALLEGADPELNDNVPF